MNYVNKIRIVISKFLFITLTIFVFSYQYAFSKEIEILNTGITFDAPDGFTEIPEEIKNIKWNSLNAPRFAIGNELAGTSIAYDIKPNNISNVPLLEVMNYISSTYERVIPGVDWLKRELVDISGQQWIFMEMTTNALDTDIHNIMLITSYNKEMLMFNFNSTKEEFLIYESELRESIKTIKLP